MKESRFFDFQDALTEAKIEIFKDYIEGYLPKLLITFKKCFIADLFCGAGKNGNQNGSPLVLIDRANYILTSPQLTNSRIYILFNDKNANNIQNLEKELKNIEINNNINIFPVQNKDFEDILPEIIKRSHYDDIPKFFFLDPFTYSDVKIKHLKEILNLRNMEILLFIPVFHSYRFASDKKMEKTHKTRIFVEEFTANGIYDYENIDGFMQSMKEKLKIELNLDFVRPVLLNYGHRKNALFLLTRNQHGMLLMNKIALKKSEDGKGIDIKEREQRTLFGTEGTSKFELFTQQLENELKTNHEMTNIQIIKFTIMEEFLPKHAKDILIEL